MNDDIYDFLNRKKTELKESENFNQWFENNKLFDEDGDPVIAFHASRQLMFDQVLPDKLTTQSHLLGGFYLSESIDDVNANYSYNGKDFTNQIVTDSEYFEGVIEYDFDEDEVLEKLPVLKEISDDIKENIFSVLQNLDSSVVTVADFPKYGLNKESLADLFNILERDFDFDNDETVLSNYEFCLMLFGTYKYSNQGWVAPFVIKMENPCITGFDEDDTMFVINPYGYEYLQEGEESQVSEHEHYDDVMDVKRTIYHEIEVNATDFENHFQNYIEQSSEHSVESIFDTYVEILECEYGYDEDEAKSICQKAFEETAPDAITFDEDGFIEDSEYVYIPNINIYNGDFDHTPEEELGEKIREALEMHFECWDRMQCHLEGHTEPMNYDTLLEIVKNNFYEAEEKQSFTDAMATVFDGVVMNAYKANKEEWGNCMEIDYNTKHYIMFDPKNIKSAIGNNGQFSTYSNGLVERKTNEAIVKNYKSKNKDVVHKHLDYIKTKFKDFNFEIKDSEFFSSKNTDALLNKDTNTVFLNSDRISDIEKLEKIITHEVIGHYGLSQLHDAKVQSVLLRVAHKYEKDIKELSELYNIDMRTREGKMKLAEEFVAFKAEKQYPNDKLITKAKNLIKKAYISFKNTLGFKTTLNEDVFELLRESKEYIENKNKPMKKHRRRM